MESVLLDTSGTPGQLPAVRSLADWCAGGVHRARVAGGERCAPGFPGCGWGCAIRGVGVGEPACMKTYFINMLPVTVSTFIPLS